MQDPQPSRRSVLGAATGLGMTSLMLPAALAAASEVTPLVSSTTTFTTGGTYQVPLGITSVIVTAEGTSGGVPPASAEGVTLKNGSAGRGGRVVATVAVTPGSDLEVVVGDSVAGQPETVSGDFPYSGGAGGAAVGLRVGGTWLVVAAGGGGGAGGGLEIISGSPNTYRSTVYAGGAGGDATGASSPASATAGTLSNPGGAASGSTAGAGGSGFISYGSFDDGSTGSVATTTLGAGGAAGYGANPGGGGGAGYAGGGGGGAANSNGGGSGGGGGSNYVVESATSVAQGYSARSLSDGVLLTIQTVVD